MSTTYPPVDVRLLQKVVKDPDGCWRFTGSISRGGYGRIKSGERREGVHRVAYLLWVGPIPDGFQVDHTCHNSSGCNLADSCPHRRCVNPAHLEAVAAGVNTLRSPNTLASKNTAKRACPKGHPYDAANTYEMPRGGRDCRACRKEAGQRRGERARA